MAGMQAAPGRVGIPPPGIQPGLTLLGELRHEAVSHIREPRLQLGHGLWQLEEALCVLTVGAHQGLPAGRELLQPFDLLVRQGAASGTIISRDPGGRWRLLLMPGAPTGPENHGRWDKRCLPDAGRLSPCPPECLAWSD